MVDGLDGKLRSFIAKPFRRDHLIRQIREVLSR
jgi:DNA-binding response OmpR family regulator